jgi:hypothetical protein
MVTDPAAPRISVGSEDQQSLFTGVNRHTLKSDGLLGGVDFLSLSFVDGDLSLLVSGDVSSGLDDTSWLESSNSDRREKRGEQKVVSR